MSSGAGVAGSNSLSLASPRESKQREGDPTGCVPSLRYRQPAVLRPGGVSLELAALRQSRSLIRLNLRSSAQTEGAIGCGNRIPKDKEGQYKDTPWRVLASSGIRYWYLAVWYFGVPLWMRRGAQGQTDQGWRCLSEAQRSEFSQTPAGPSTAGCPGAKRRGRSNQGRLSFAYFSLAKQRKVSCRRATPASQP